MINLNSTYKIIKNEDNLTVDKIINIQNSNEPSDNGVYCLVYQDEKKFQKVYIGSGKRERCVSSLNERKKEMRLKDYEGEMYVYHIISEYNLTKGVAELIEDCCIRILGIGNLLNKVYPIKNIMSERKKEYYDKMWDFSVEMLKNMHILNIDFTFKSKITPKCISKEIIDQIFFNKHDKITIFNPCCREGEIISVLQSEGKMDHVKKIILLDQNIERLNKYKILGKYYGMDVKQITVYNEDLYYWNDNIITDFDIGIMNPPFKEHGEKFINILESYINPGGYMGIVMSPYWSSIGVELNKEKSYQYLLKRGRFKFIHMYSANDTSLMFNANIGQVHIFVWQKYDPENDYDFEDTLIINKLGETFRANLDNYPQSPPVIDPEIYDKHFDQKKGLKWKMYGGGGTVAGVSKGDINIKFDDIFTGKSFFCSYEIKKKTTKGSKVMVDSNFTKYIVDDIGDVVINRHKIFFYDTENELECIKRTLDFIIDNNLQDLFIIGTSLGNANIPAIRIEG